MGERLTDVFLQLFCEKNADGTKNLVLKGKDLQQRIDKRIESEDMYKICTFLRNHPEVVELNVCYNNIGDSGIEILVDEYLKDENKLLHLNLMYNDITDLGTLLLFNVPQLTLVSLRMNGNKIGREGGRYLALLLRENHTIQYLDVAETDQTLESVAYFTKCLNYNFNGNTTLRVLDLSRIVPCFDRYAYDTEHLAKSIGRILQFNKSLVEIHLQKNQLGGHDIEYLINGLEKNDSLLFLDIGYNKIGDYGIEKISDYLKRKRQLLGLNVAANGIHDAGARALSFGMPFSRIRLLDITHNSISDIGIQDILNSIKKPYMMRVLYMWGNEITHPTIKILKRMLMSTVLTQTYIDVKIYEVDRVLYVAYYPSDRFKHMYYCQMDHACTVELKIKKNKLPCHVPRELIGFKHYPRFPPCKDAEGKKRNKHLKLLYMK